MHIQRREKFEFYKMKFEEVEIDPPIDVTTMRVGVDPGTVHLGIAVLVPNRTGLLYEITMKRDNDPMVRLHRTNEALSRVFYYFEYPEFRPYVIIEGASYADMFRQVELAEQRAAIGLWMDEHYHCPVLFKPPLTIAKDVFGSGKARAWNEWPHLPKNAASALACAIFPIDVKELQV